MFTLSKPVFYIASVGETKKHRNVCVFEKFSNEFSVCFGQRACHFDPQELTDPLVTYLLYYLLSKQEINCWDRLTIVRRLVQQL